MNDYKPLNDLSAIQASEYNKPNLKSHIMLPPRVTNKFLTEKRVAMFSQTNKFLHKLPSDRRHYVSQDIICSSMYSTRPQGGGISVNYIETLLFYIILVEYIMKQLYNTRNIMTR